MHAWLRCRTEPAPQRGDTSHPRRTPHRGVLDAIEDGVSWVPGRFPTCALPCKPLQHSSAPLVTDAGSYEHRPVKG